MSPVYFRSVSPVDSSLPCLRPQAPASRSGPGSGQPLRSSIPSLSSSSSKESSSGSRSSLTESRIPISKSQDDLLRNVALRSQTDRQRERRPVSSGKLLRPTSYRNQSPRNSKLMSRNSVEVLAYTETQQQENKTESETGRKYYSQYSKINKKYETASKFTKKFGSKDSSLNLYQKNTKKPVNTINGNTKPAGLSNRNSSLIPQPSTLQTRNNLKNSEKKPTQPVKTTTSVKSSPARPSLGKLSSDPSKKNVGVAGNSHNTKSSANLTPSNKDNRVSSQAKRLSGEQSKLDDRTKSAKTESVKTPVSETAEMISPGPGPGPRLRPGLVNTPETVERLITEQLNRGKLPPKAKFRADDEISIGEPETTDPSHHHPSPAGKLSSSARKGPVTPKADKSVKTRSELGHDSYPPSHASLLVARCLEESGRARGHKTNSLPLHSALGGCDLSRGEKSTSLDKYYKAEKPAEGKGASEGFFQRLSNLRRSFNSHDHKRSASNQGGGGKIRPHLTDSNTPFFQGISHKVKRPNSGNNNSRHHKVCHSSYLVLPPVIPSYKPPARKYQFQRAFPVRLRAEAGLRRSFSFSDCQVGFISTINLHLRMRNLNTFLHNSVKSVTKLTISISGDWAVCGGQ